MAAQEATEFVAFSNARMFNYVVSKEDVCQKLVERILGIEVDRIEFEAEEHSIQPGLQGLMCTREEAGNPSMWRCRPKQNSI